MSVPAGWTPLPVETDPDAVTTRILDGLRERLNPDRDPAGWRAREGALEVALAEEIGRETAATNARTADAADAAFAGFGISVHGLAPILGAPATIPVTITVTGGGAVVPAGLVVIGTGPDGIGVAFTSPAELVSEGTTVLADLTATQVGAAGNAVPAGPLQVVTATATVRDVVADAPSTGGVDAETRTEYLARLVDFLALLRPGGVRAADLAILARNTPGVWRALAVDLYDAQTNAENAERTVSVYPVGEDGRPVTEAVAAALRASLEAVREVNFIFRVAAPAYTAVAVAAQVVAEEGADPAAAATNAAAALRGFLSPATWGASTGDPRAWSARSTVRYLELARVAGSADGVAYVAAITLNGGSADVVLPGRAALPAPVDPTWPGGGSTIAVAPVAAP